MKKLVSISGLFTLLLILASCGNEEETNAQAGASQASPYPVTNVPQRTVTGYTTYPVKIEGIINSEVRAKVSGYITDVLVDEGQEVKKGQLLFKLETQSLNQDAAAAKANVNAAQVEVDKLKPLVEKDIISNVQLETAKARLQQAQSSYNSVAANIGYANIKSPVDGYVGSIRLREGALVSPTSEQPLTTVSNISKVYAYFSMNETEYFDFLKEYEGEKVEDKIKNMPEVELKLANGTTYSEKGKIGTINSQVNENTGSISFRAVFDNPSRLLSNGSSGNILIPKTYDNAIIVPQESTFERQGNVLVYKVGEDNKVNSSTLEIITRIDNLYVVKSGVEEGETIVAKGLTKLRPDAQIQPQPMAFDSVAKPIEKVFR